MECKLSFTIAVIVLLGGAVRIKAKCFTLSSKFRRFESNSSKELDHLVKVGSSQGSGKTEQRSARCDGKFTTDPDARFQIRNVKRNQIVMKCIQWGEYALKAINNTNKWELVFERQNCPSADGSFLFRETCLGKVHRYSWETASGVRMYLSCDRNNSALSLTEQTEAASVDARTLFAKRRVDHWDRSRLETCPAKREST